MDDEELDVAVKAIYVTPRFTTYPALKPGTRFKAGYPALKQVVPVNNYDEINPALTEVINRDVTYTYTCSRRDFTACYSSLRRVCIN